MNALVKHNMATYQSTLQQQLHTKFRDRLSIPELIMLPPRILHALRRLRIHRQQVNGLLYLLQFRCILHNVHHNNSPYLLFISSRTLYRLHSHDRQQSIRNIETTTIKAPSALINMLMIRYEKTSDTEIT